MLLYCLKCPKDTESKNPKVTRTKNGRIMLLSKCAVCDSKKSTFIKQQNTSGLLSSLGVKTSSSKIPLVGPLLFYRSYQVSSRYKMNERVNSTSLAEDRFMPEMHLKQPGFTDIVAHLQKRKK